MDTNKSEQLVYFSEIYSYLDSFSITDIENGIMNYCLSKYNYSNNEYSNSKSRKISNILEKNCFSTEIENIVEFFESLLSTSNKEENGIVFTPKYIADFINNNTMTQFPDNLSIIDPGCGCGIFLVSAAELLLQKTTFSINEIIEKHLFGIEIDKDNARRCKLVLKLLCAKHKGNIEKLNYNIRCSDSLKTNWSSLFNIQSFTYIIGNPPYVNPHDMKKETSTFLKNTFTTTKTGVFNIFYAFIEQGMSFLSHDGKLGFIIPNNFFTIKAAYDLRLFLQNNYYISRIIDFDDNMVFKPVRTYNCIMFLDKKEKKEFEYYVMPKTSNIEYALNNCPYQKMPIEELDINSWNLVDEKTRKNLRTIESFDTSIKQFIRTGIATLKDEVYFVNKDENGFFKLIDNKKFYIEPELVKDIYKIPELKKAASLNSVKRYIIFPYERKKDGYEPIPEQDFKNKYPKTYTCLEKNKTQLNSRDKGKGVQPFWYAYGRSQGLNKYGKKLLFPTFSNIPKFVYVDNEDALFCNGYAVFEDDSISITTLQKILNSKVMEYYVNNTSYSIEGGYYCYQKKYVENFSIPNFSRDEINYINTANKSDLDTFLWEHYNLT